MVDGRDTQTKSIFSDKILCTLFPFDIFLADEGAICFGKLCQRERERLLFIYIYFHSRRAYDVCHDPQSNVQLHDTCCRYLHAGWGSALW